MNQFLFFLSLFHFLFNLSLHIHFFFNKLGKLWTIEQFYKHLYFLLSISISQSTLLDLSFFSYRIFQGFFSLFFLYFLSFFLYSLLFSFHFSVTSYFFVFFRSFRIFQRFFHPFSYMYFFFIFYSFILFYSIFLISFSINSQATSPRSRISCYFSMSH